MTSAPVKPWKLKASGSSLRMVADADELATAIRLFADAECGFELMALRSGVHACRLGADVEGLVDAAKELPSGAGLYFRVNPIMPGLSHPARNEHVAYRRWLYIDVDPVKAEGQEDNPASDREKEATSGVCDKVHAHLSAYGWPMPIVVDSGNGYGLFYRCQLPNDKATQAAFRRLLLTLSLRFTCDDGIIDKSVHNANRLAKLPGTWARKGAHTDDRPHRPCRLFFVPDVVGSVTLEQLLAAGESAEDDGPDSPSRTFQTSPSADSAYGRKALDAECLRVAMARPGAEEGRNNALNRAAFALGQLVAGGVLDRSTVEQRLYEAAAQSGLETDPGCGEKGIRGTIRSGLEAGLKTPRGIPESKDPKAKFEKQREEAKAELQGERLTVRMSQIKPLQVQWLMKNRIPLGFITVMAGRTGIGKSYVSLDLIARLSKGAEIPFADGECFKPSGTLILSEDSPEYVIAPRLIDAGADMSRIHAMTWKAMGAYHLADTAMLSQACDEVEGGIKLLLIDPPTNFLKETDEHKNAEVRQLVMKVVEWALERNVAVLFILHVNKGAQGVDALNRVMGSVAWVTTSRIAHALIRDPDEFGRNLWIPLKSNIGELPKAIAYRIAKANGATRVQWVEELNIDADDAMSRVAPKERRDVKASKWLVDMFRQRLEWESEDLFDRAENEGISRSAIFDGKDLLKLPRARRTVKENGEVCWVWWVPSDWPPLKEGIEDGSN